MFYSSRYSRKRIYHYADCRYVKRTREDNQIIFHTLEEAKNRNYIPCACCSVIGRQYANDRKSISAFCEHYNFKHFLYLGELYIVSARDTAWKISYADGNDKGKSLLHESKSHVSYDRLITPYIDREYHIQKTPTTSIMGYLVYIQRHDVFEKEHKEKIKAQQAICREEVKSIRATQKQAARQNRKHRKHHQFESNGQKRRRSNQQLKALASSFTDYRAARAAYI